MYKRYNPHVKGVHFQNKLCSKQEAEAEVWSSGANDTVGYPPVCNDPT